MSTWAKVVESWEAVPEVYRDAYCMVVAEGASLPYTVFAPAIAGAGHKTAAKLVCEVGDTLYVWERVGRQVAMVAYPLRTISDLEVGSILLYSWITIGGVTQAGTVSSATIEYNTATARHFAPFVNKLRPAPKEMDKSEACRRFVDFVPDALPGWAAAGDYLRGCAKASRRSVAVRA